MTQSFRLDQSSAAATNSQSGAFEAAATSPSRSLPTPAHASQAYFWTPEWQQRERLADWDFLIGDEYKPDDVDDLIRHLHEAASAETS